MLKKILYILGFMMIASAVVQPLIAHGEGDQYSTKEEDVPFSTSRLFSKITGGKLDGDWRDSFGKKEDEEGELGQNLYLIIYKKVVADPDKQAFKNVAASYGMTESELSGVVQGELSVIMDKKKGLSVEEAHRKANEITEQFNEEKELLSLNADIKAAVEPTEMFANGDVDDSGFDLINDLIIIEKILFLNTDAIDVGEAYTSETGDGGLPLPGSINNPPASPVNDVQADQEDNFPAKQTNGNNSGNPKQADKNQQDGKKGNGKDGEGAVDPSSCIIGDKFDDAFTKFDQQKQQDKNLKDNNVGKINLNMGGSKNGDNASGFDDSGNNSDNFFEKKPDTSGKPLPPGQPGEWLKDEPCDKIFCLDIKMIKKPATSAFSNSDNCIACHLEKINDTLKKVINHSLAPSKAPGNLGESAKCKKGVLDAFAASMNIYVQSMPVKTPTNDDLMYGTNIEDDLQSFCGINAFFPFEACKKTNGTTYEPPELLQETVAQRELSFAPDEAAIEEVKNNMDIALQGYQDARKEALSQDKAAKKASDAAGAYNPLKVELDNMNSYFTAFQDILHSLHDKVPSMPGKQACGVLKNKEECK